MNGTQDLPVREPLWASALLAASNGCMHPQLHRGIQWDSGRASLRFTNAGQSAVMIPELGVLLGAGSTLNVSWPPGATAYEFSLTDRPRKRAATNSSRSRHHLM